MAMARKLPDMEHIKVSGFKAKNKEKGEWNIRQEHHIKGNGKKTSLMEKGFILMKLRINMREIFKMV